MTKENGSVDTSHLIAPSVTRGIEDRATVLLGELQVGTFRTDDKQVVSIKKNRSGNVLKRIETIVIEKKGTKQTNPDEPTTEIEPFERLSIITSSSEGNRGTRVEVGYYNHDNKPIITDVLTEQLPERVERIKSYQELVNGLTEDHRLNEFDRTVAESRIDAENAEKVHRAIDRLFDFAKEEDAVLIRVSEGGRDKVRTIKFTEDITKLRPDILIIRATDIFDTVNIVVDIADDPSVPGVKRARTLRYTIPFDSSPDQRISYKVVDRQMIPDSPNLADGSGISSSANFASQDEINQLIERLNKLTAANVYK